MFRFVPVTAIIVVIAGCAGEPDTPSHWSAEGANTTPDSAYGVVFFDDFNAGEIDRTKWNVVGPNLWVNNEQQIYQDTTWTVVLKDSTDGAGDGVLALTARWAEGTTSPRGRTADFVSGRINSRDKFDFMYGRAEARLRMPDAIGMWPAFWLLGYGRWPGSGEIDIMEYVGEKDWTAVAVHGPGYSGDQAPVDNSYFPEGQDATGWHVYAVDWTHNEMTFYVDDRLIYRIGRPLVTFFGDWRFDSRKFLILNTAIGGAYPFKINGVTEPYFGLPAGTAEKIQEGGLAMEVDWVRVTRDPDRHAGG